MNKRPKLSVSERESLGRWVRKVWLVIKQNEQAAGKVVSEEDLALWDRLPETEREIFRQSGQDMANRETYWDRVNWAAVETERSMMGEKAFREQIYSICVSIVIEGIEQHTDKSERLRAVEGIVRMAGMLQVPKDAHMNMPGGNASV